MAENDRSFRIAVAGLAATAILGIVGSTTNWLSARDARHTQAELAYQDRVYNRRADTYLAALGLIHAHQLEMHEAERKVGGPSGTRANLTIGRDGIKVRNVYAQLQAFGSKVARQAFDDIRAQAWRFELMVGGEVSVEEHDVIVTRMRAAIARFVDAVHEEVG